MRVTSSRGLFLARPRASFSGSGSEAVGRASASADAHAKANASLSTADAAGWDDRSCHAFLPKGLEGTASPGADWGCIDGDHG